MNSNFSAIFRVTSRYLPADFSWPERNSLDEVLHSLPDASCAPPFLADLARVEWTYNQLTQKTTSFSQHITARCINPTLELIDVKWSHLADLLNGKQTEPAAQEGLVAFFRPQQGADVQVISPTGHELLALKIAAENLDRKCVAVEAGVHVEDIDAILSAAQRKGLILCPQSRIVHPFSSKRPEVFTLQWHVTQKCDLHCRHCYDRSTRQEMTWESAEYILDQFYAFCESCNVAGQVSFSGGNPFLYRHFADLYGSAVKRGFMTAILGNPVPRQQLENIIRLRPPAFYQVSLEGLQQHNDYIRGKNHFTNVLEFLDLLKELNIYRIVMLTLTRENVDQTIPLGELLAGKVEKFTFNRLAPVGEGSALATVPPSQYRDFLRSYLNKARTNPHFGCKDNLFNILQDNDGLAPMGGCTGFGCGAALNFVSVLSDGEVHACRKFPSPIGNIFTTSLVDLYSSKKARQYRQGSAACRDCRLRHVCGGCLAVVHGKGGNVLTDLDPYCFIDPPCSP